MPSADATQLMTRALAGYAASMLIVAMAGACSRGPDRGAAPAVDVVELSAAAARDRMAAGSLTARALTEAYLDRIARIDDDGPTLRAVVDINPRALADADALDDERARGNVRGPLHGIPILIKDNIDAAGMVNSAGSIALAHHRPVADAFIVRRLREAGAVVLGRTNLSEWANFRSTRSTSGWSSRGGQTKNPYVLDRNPCGSSSGTGAAIAASLATIGVGTETDGSIMCPAAVNGLVGLKPTVGLVSRHGIIPISASQDTPGPMGRTVADVAALLNVLAARDDRDPAAASAPGERVDYTAALNGGALAGRRLGILREATGYHPDVDAAFARAVAAMRSQGAQVIDVTIPSYDAWGDAELEVLLYEFKDGLNRYLQASGAPYASLEALITFNAQHADKVMPYFGQELFERAQAKGPLTEPAYLKARADSRRLAGDAGLFAALDAHTLDAIIAPTTSPAWPTDFVLGDHFVRSGYSIAAVAGTPSLTVPIGESHGLPLGLTFMGRPLRESDLIGMAYALEQVMQARRSPAFKPTLVP